MEFRDTEKYLEIYLRDMVKKKGGKSYKWVAPGENGVPDRIVLMPGGKIRFIELKSKGKIPKPLQEYQHRLLRSLGFQMDWIDNYNDLQKYIDAL